MTSKPANQVGASAIGTVLLLVILAYGIFVGIQWVPQIIESSSVDSVLNSIESTHRSDPVRSAQAARTLIDNHLQINQMQDLKEVFTVREWANDYVIEVSYERQLNLLYETRTLHYEKSLTLD